MISACFSQVHTSAVFVLAAGLQAVLPEYLRARFVEAALSYVGCNEEGLFVCRDNDCWCQCAADYPQCNCPEVDLKAMETSLLKIRDSWTTANQDFEESGQFCLGFFCFTLWMNVNPPLIENRMLLSEELMGKVHPGANPPRTFRANASGRGDAAFTQHTNGPKMTQINIWLSNFCIDENASLIYINITYYLIWFGCSL